MKPGICDFVNLPPEKQFELVTDRHTVDDPIYLRNLREALKEGDIKPIAYIHGNVGDKLEKVYRFLMNPVGMKIHAGRDARSRSGFGYQHTTFLVKGVADENRLLCEITDTREEYISGERKIRRSAIYWYGISNNDY